MPPKKEFKYIPLTRIHVAAISAFLICFLIQIFLNSFVGICRSLPDELGAMYLASALSGNDWSYVMTHPAYYYGSLTFPLLYPFFELIKDPLLLYQCLLGVGAFLRSLPVLICFYIMVRYFKIENIKIVFLVSMAGCFLAPTRATNIDNEPILILCCWLLMLLLISLQEDLPGKTIKYKSILLSFVLTLSLLAHTRAILYTLAVTIVILLFHVLTGKHMVNYKYFISSFLGMYAGSRVIVQQLTGFLYPLDKDAFIANTSGSLQMQIQAGIDNLIGDFGIQSFLDLFNSNLTVIFVFSCGIIIYSAWNCFFGIFDIGKNYIVKKRMADTKSILFPLTFCIIGGGTAILGLCVTWLGGAVEHHLNGSNLTRGYFYLRYYSNFFGPLVMLLFCQWIKERNDSFLYKNRNKIAFCTIMTLIVCSICMWLSFLSEATYEPQHTLSDWFYYFAPFSLKFISWPDISQNLMYFIVAIILSCAVFIAIMLFVTQKKYIGGMLILLIALVYQYTYMVIFWDRPYSYSDNYYGSINATYDFKKQYPDLLRSIEKIYYENPVYGPQYLIQFVLQDIPVILENPEEEAEVVLIASSFDAISDKDKVRGTYQYYPLDNNEFIFVKGEKYQEAFRKEGFTLLPLTIERIFSLEGAVTPSDEAAYSTVPVKLRRGTYQFTTHFVNEQTSVMKGKYKVVDIFRNQIVAEGDYQDNEPVIKFSVGKDNTPIQIDFYEEGKTKNRNIIIDGWKYDSFEIGADNLESLETMMQLLEKEDTGLKIACLISQETDISLNTLKTRFPQHIFELKTIDQIKKNKTFDCIIAPKTNDHWWQTLNEYTVLYSFENYNILISMDGKLENAIDEISFLSNGNVVSASLWNTRNQLGLWENTFLGLTPGRYSVRLKANGFLTKPKYHVEIWSDNRLYSSLTLDGDSILEVPLDVYTPVNDFRFYLYDDKQELLDYDIVGISQKENAASFVYGNYFDRLVQTQQQLDGTAAILIDEFSKQVPEIKEYLAERNLVDIPLIECDFGSETWLSDFGNYNALFLPDRLNLIYPALEKGYTIAGHSEKYTLLYKGRSDIIYPYSEKSDINMDYFTSISDIGVTEKKVSLPEGIFAANIKLEISENTFDPGMILGAIQIFDGNELLRSVDITTETSKNISVPVSRRKGISDLKIKFSGAERGLIKGDIISISKKANGFLTNLSDMYSTVEPLEKDDNHLKIYSENNEIIYGPYYSLDSGSYNVCFEYAVDSDQSIAFDVSADLGTNILGSIDSSRAKILENGNYEVRLDIWLEEDTPNIEFRCHIPNNLEFQLKQISVEKSS